MRAQARVLGLTVTRPERAALPINDSKFHFLIAPSTLHPDGGGCARSSPRCHSISLYRLDGPIRSRALGIRSSGAITGRRAWVWERVRRYGADGGPASGLLLPARGNLQDLRHRDQSCGACGFVVEQPVLSPHLRSGIPAGQTSVRPARGEMGGLGMGVISLRRLLRRGLGVVDVPGYARTGMAVSICLAAGEIVSHSRLDSVRRLRRHRSADRASCAGGRSAAGAVDRLPALWPAAIVERADGGGCARRDRCYGSLVHS